jgi:hypothetical protein
MSDITRHTWITSGRTRRCMGCYEFIHNTSLQFRIRGESHDREYCLQCCHEDERLQEIANIYSKFI